MPRPIAIDLFAGAGGLSLGFEQAGFEVVAAIEIDPVHAAVHKFNFPQCLVIPQSVSTLTGSQIRAAAHLGSKKIDVVFGGPPCQGFSMMGHRSIDDPRNTLVLDYLRLVCELDATYFVFENVKGITIGRHRRFLEEFIAEANERGYDIVLPWKVLDAADFGVPQHRQRLILYGAKQGSPLPCYPSSTHDPADRIMPCALRKGPSCSDALDDIPDAESFEELTNKDAVRVQSWDTPSNDFAREMRCLDDLNWHLGNRRKWDPLLLTSSLRTAHSKTSRSRFAKTEPGIVEPTSRFFRLNSNGLCNTLRAGTDSARGAFTSPRPIHHRLARCVTVREMARLHGFPDWFRFHQTKWHGARQIGNAVPPPLARAVASSIFGALGTRTIEHPQEIELGDDRLLYMNMAQAAAHFGVTPPISKRDRLSGAKKIRQQTMDEPESQIPHFEVSFDFGELIGV